MKTSDFTKSFVFMKSCSFYILKEKDMNMLCFCGNNEQSKAMRKAFIAFFEARGVSIDSLIKMLDKYIKNPSLLDAKPSEHPEKKPITKSESHEVDDAQF